MITFKTTQTFYKGVRGLLGIQRHWSFFVAVAVCGALTEYRYPCLDRFTLQHNINRRRFSSYLASQKKVGTTTNHSHHTNRAKSTGVMASKITKLYGRGCLFTAVLPIDCPCYNCVPLQ